MDVVEVDERDSSWEDHEPRFRVYLFDGGDGAKGDDSWSTCTYDITGADVLEVVHWARERAGAGLFSVVLVRDETLSDGAATARGLVWLVGHDANDKPMSDVERHLADRMVSRRGFAS